MELAVVDLIPDVVMFDLSNLLRFVRVQVLLCVLLIKKFIIFNNINIVGKWYLQLIMEFKNKTKSKYKLKI